jgi:hypothetical protein
MQRRKDRCFLLKLVMAGNVLGADRLERQGDSGGQHQQRIYRCDMRESRWPQHSGGYDVVDKVGNSNQARSGEQSQAAAQQLLPQGAGLHLFRAGRNAPRCIPYSKLPNECHRLGYAGSEESEMHNRKHSVSTRPWKVVEGLLLHTDG